ncbi:MAG: SET family sugar efflux transporter-like MFS transporter [Psychromonas sp.]|jgi:SET family sugar efflux transporter-like MFS transporter|uniref:sugar efflux transporter n=1 Tax=Psychromonas sp. TaxID=1884585 RepID=UPI0039E3449B
MPARQPPALGTKMVLLNQTNVLFTLNGLTALAFSVVLPIMSLFLVSELNAQPASIGIYTSLTAIMTIVVSQKLTGLIDKGISSLLLLVISLLGIIFAAIGFSLATEFWHALLIGCILMPFASSSVSIILAIIRRHADASGKDSARLNSQMRSTVSLLWIVGPPFAFMSVDTLGFKSNFYFAALIACVVIVLAVALFKPQRMAATINHHVIAVKLPRPVWFLAGVILLTNMANGAYITAIPIYITEELGFPTSYPGLLLGLTAAVEIPAMLLAVGWSRRFGKSRVLKGGLAAGVIFYACMYYSSSFYLFLALQIFNGLFYGIFVGLGVTIMQDFAPNSIGKISAFYSNAMLTGSMLGTSCMGVISQYFGFKAPLLLSLSCLLIAFVVLMSFEKASLATSEVH